MPKGRTRAVRPLEKGVANAPAIITASASDWPTYRSTVARSGSCAAIVPSGAVIRWTFAPFRAASRAGSTDGSDQEPAKPDVNVTQPVAVGERTWFGTAEGAVVCLDRKTGAEAWRYWTTGRIVSSPTWWQERLYAGSCDGWVYRHGEGGKTLRFEWERMGLKRAIVPATVLSHADTKLPIE
jgi:outer membrane protein assembly factor BamB